MSPLKYTVALAAAFVAGCAATPAPSSSVPPEAIAAETVPAAPDSAEPLAAAALEPTVVELRASDPDPKVGEVICREELLHASNVINKRCMTAVDWARYQRMQELQAQDFLRRLRGEL
jgi:PBP1b-binding outer membrane lipoprotein LpoB